MDKIKAFTSSIGSIIALVIILGIICANFVRLVMWIKCFRIKECNNRKCSFKCYKYHEKLTEEDYKRILDKIAEL